MPGGPLHGILGPTGTGKSALALALCERVQGEIVTVDSAQVFRGLDVGTATPPAQELARVPHHLINVIEPDAQWSAAEFAHAADAVIDEVRSRSKIPVLCGGTGLWLRALVRGIFEAPQIDPQLREEIRAQLKTEGAIAMHAELSRIDPEAAAKIEPQDPQRIGRALEVFRQTGEKISALQAAHGFKELRYQLLGVQLAWDREALAPRLEKRARAMFQEGMLQETERCLSRGIAEDAPGLSIIGYRDAVDHLRGRISLEEAIRRTTVATRRYAKRQRNWFRHEPEVHPIDPTTRADQVWELLRAREAAL